MNFRGCFIGLRGAFVGGLGGELAGGLGRALVVKHFFWPGPGLILFYSLELDPEMGRLVLLHVNREFFSMKRRIDSDIDLDYSHCTNSD